MLLLLLLLLVPLALGAGSGQSSWSTLANSGGQHKASLGSNLNFGVRLFAGDGVTPVAGWTAGAAHVVQIWTKTATYTGFTGYIWAPFSGTITTEPAACATASNLLCPSTGSALCTTYKLGVPTGSTVQAQMGASCKIGMTHKSSTAAPAQVTTASATWTAPATGFGAVTFWATVIPMATPRGGAKSEFAFTTFTEAVAAAPSVTGTPSAAAAVAASATSTHSGTPPASPTPTPTPTATPSSGSSPSATPSTPASPSPSPSATLTPTPPATPPATPLAAASASRSPSPSPTPTGGAPAPAGASPIPSALNASAAKAESGSVTWSGGGTWLKVAWVIARSAANSQAGTVAFTCTSPGQVWISLALSTNGLMFGPGTGVAIVGQPNDAVADAPWASHGGPIQMTYMRGYGVNQMDKVNLPQDALSPAFSLAYDPSSAVDPVNGLTTLVFGRAFDDSSPAGVTWGDPRDLPFSVARPLGWIYGVGYMAGAWADGHPLRGYDTLSLTTCTRQFGCGGNGNCSASALASVVLPGYPKCVCDPGSGWDAAADCKACLTGYSRSASGASCTPATGNVLTLTTTLLLGGATSPALAAVLAGGAVNTTALGATLAALLGVAPASRVSVALAPSALAPGALALSITLSDTLQSSSQVLGAAAASTTPATPASQLAATLAASLSNVTSTPLGASVLSAAAAALSLPPPPAAFFTTPAYAPALALAPMAGYCDPTSPSSQCAFPFSVPLSNGLVLSWRLDALALYMRVTWTRPGAEYINAAKGGSAASPKPALNWFGVALSPSALMPGGDSVVVEPGQPPGLQVRRWRLNGYTMADCTPLAGEAALPSYTSYTSVYTPPTALLGGGRRAQGAQGAQGAGAGAPDTWVTTATFARPLAVLTPGPGALPLTEAGAQAASTITWGWGNPVQGTLGMHSSKEAGSLLLDLTTGQVLRPPCGQHCQAALAAHAALGLLGFFLLLAPWAALNSPATCGRPCAAGAASLRAGRGVLASAVAPGPAPKGALPPPDAPAPASPAAATAELLAPHNCGGALRLGVLCALGCLLSALVLQLQLAGRSGAPAHFASVHSAQGGYAMLCLGLLCALLSPWVAPSVPPAAATGAGGAALGLATLAVLTGVLEPGVLPAAMQAQPLGLWVGTLLLLAALALGATAAGWACRRAQAAQQGRFLHTGKAFESARSTHLSTRRYAGGQQSSRMNLVLQQPATARA